MFDTCEYSRHHKASQTQDTRLSIHTTTTLTVFAAIVTRSCSISPCIPRSSTTTTMYSSGSLDSRRNSRDYGGRGGRGGRGGGGFRQRDFGPPRGQGPYSRDGPPPPRQFSQGRPHNGPPPQAPLQIDREKVGCFVCVEYWLPAHALDLNFCCKHRCAPCCFVYFPRYVLYGEYNCLLHSAQSMDVSVS